jgi:hypothetical protein
VLGLGEVESGEFVVITVDTPVTALAALAASAK